jgi:hypothetical protein
VASVNRHLPSTAIWPTADALVASFDLDSAAAKLVERRTRTNHGPGRPARGRTCQIEGCGGKFLAKGYCAKHYQQAQREALRANRRLTWGEMAEALKKGNRTRRAGWYEYTYLEWKPSAGEVFIMRGIGSDEEIARGEIEWVGNTHTPTAGDLIADDWAFYTDLGGEP